MARGGQLCELWCDAGAQCMILVLPVAHTPPLPGSTQVDTVSLQLFVKLCHVIVPQLESPSHSVVLLRILLLANDFLKLTSIKITLGYKDVWVLKNAQCHLFTKTGVVQGNITTLKTTLCFICSAPPLPRHENHRYICLSVAFSSECRVIWVLQ